MTAGASGAGGVKTGVNLTKTGPVAQSLVAACFISVNNRLTVSSHSAPSVRGATLLVSEKPAASAKCWYLLSSFWFAPAPGEPRPERRRAAAPKAALLAGLRPPSGRGSNPTLGSAPARSRTSPAREAAARGPNARPMRSTRAFAPLHARATYLGHYSKWLLSLASEDPPPRGFSPKPLYEAPSPTGPRPF